MMKRWISSLRGRLSLLVLGAMLPLAIYTTFDAVGHSWSLRSGIADSALQSSRSVVDAEARALESGRLLLDLLARIPQVRTADPAQCGEILAEILRSQPRYAALAVFNAQGDAICSGVPLTKPINSADRSWFQRAVATRRFAVGDYQIGRVTGKASLGMAAPLLSANGEVEGVVYAALDLAWFSERGAAPILPDGAIFVMADGNGVILALQPDSQAWVGKNAEDQPLIRTLKSTPPSSDFEAIGLDGVRRLYHSFSLALDDEPKGGQVLAAVGIDLGPAEAQYNRALAQNLVFVGLLTLALLIIGHIGAGVVVVGPVRALTRLSQRVAAGDLAARSGLKGSGTELDMLARDLDGMAQSLADQRDALLRQTERLDHQKSFLAAVLDNIQDGVIVCDADGKLELFNAAAQRMFRTPELESQPPVEWLKHADAYMADGVTPLALEQLPLYRALQGETISNMEMIAASKGMQQRIFLAGGQPMIDAHGNKLGAVLSLTDVTERRRAERERERTQMFLGAVLQSIREGIMACDADGRLILSNRAARKLHGIPAAPVPLDQWAAHYDIHAVDGGALMKTEDLPLFRALRGEIVVDAEELIAPKGQPARHAMVNGQAIFDAAGGKLGAVVSIHDVTEARQKEAALQASEARYRAIVEDQTELVTRSRPDGALTYVNPAYCRCYGKTPEQLIGQSWHGHMVEADQLRVLAYLATLTRENPNGTIEHRVTLPDGSVRWQQWTDRALFNGGDRPIEYQSVGRDITERKLVEEALLVSEARYRAIVEDQAEFVTRYSPAGLVTYANEAFCRYRGLPREKLLGSSVFADVAEGDLNLLRAHFAGLTRDNPIAVAEHRAVGPRGETRWQQWTDRALFDGGDQTIEYQSVGRDITDRKRAEAALRERDAYLRGILDNMLEGIVTIDERGIVESINPATLKILNYTAAEVIGQNVKLLMPEPYRAEHDGYIARYLETGKGRILGIGPREVTARRKDGTTLPIELAIAEAWLDHRRIFIGSIRDITDRKRAEAALRDSERRYRQLVEATDAVAYSWDIEAKRFLFISPQAVTLLGYPAESWTDETFWASCLPPEERQTWIDLTRRLNDAGEDHQDEYRMIRADGRTIWIRDIVRCGRDDAGRRIAYGLMFNVTESKNRDTQLLQAQKMDAIGQLTGGVAHDFNNMLMVIMGGLDMLRPAIRDNQKGLAQLDLAMAAAIHGSELTDRLLAFARRQVLQSVPTDVNGLISSLTPLLRRTLGAAVQIKLMLAADLWPANVDPTQLETAVLNLAINARDAMPDGGILIIETANANLGSHYVRDNPQASAGDYVMVAVSDTGEGMTPDVLASAFEPFFTTKEVGKGTGLGLSMVYGFIKQSGGHAKIYSEVGHGTTIKLYLPRSAGAAAEAPASADDGEEPRGDELILVVEDDERVRATAIMMLEDLGYRLLTASDGRGALEILDQHPGIDLLFTDVVMPGGMNGPALAQEARKRRPNLKVLYTSGYTENAIVHGGKLDQDIHWLGKPYPRSQLARKIRAVLDERIEP